MNKTRQITCVVDLSFLLFFLLFLYVFFFVFLKLQFTLTLDLVRHGAGHEEIDARGAGAVAQERNVTRIAPELSHVVLDPLQGRYLVPQAEVSLGPAGIRLDARPQES